MPPLCPSPPRRAPPVRAGGRTNGARCGSSLPYLWEFKWRVLLALAFLVAAKLANVGVPLVLKEVVDSLDPQTGGAGGAARAARRLRRCCGFSTTLFAELRDVVFVRVAQRAIRRVALSVFRHLHSLSLRFHLERQTGGVSRDIERGTRGISTLLSLHAVLDHPGDPRVRPGGGGAAREVRLALRRDHVRRGGGLHRLHDPGDRVAHRDPPPRQRARLEGQHARHRQPAQLRDGQVLRQRGVRGAALRREPAAATSRPRSRARPRSACSTSARASSSRSR